MVSLNKDFELNRIFNFQMMCTIGCTLPLHLDKTRLGSVCVCFWFYIFNIKFQPLKFIIVDSGRRLFPYVSSGAQSTTTEV